VRPPHDPRQLAQRLLAAGRLAGVDGAADVLRGQLQHPGELARLHQQLTGPLRVAAGQLVVADARTGLLRRSCSAPATSGRHRATSRSRRALGALEDTAPQVVLRVVQVRPGSGPVTATSYAVHVTVVTVPSKASRATSASGPARARAVRAAARARPRWRAAPPW
jgi:hypothetical protein